MELEFDKEIDAILRKTRRAGDVTAVKTAHLDADAIAAFAENAVPERAKLLYTEHLADCGPCRKLLAGSMAWPPAETIPKSVAAVAETSIPWYSRLFRTPNLALAMGGLVLVFGGILAFLVISRNSADRNSTVSQVKNVESRERVADEPVQPQAANSNAAMSNSAAAANVAANSMPSEVARTENETPAKPGARGPAETPPPAAGFSSDGMDSLAKSPADQPKVVGAAPPPPVAASRPPETDERKDKNDADKEERGRDAKKQEDSMVREAAPAGSRKAVVGPNSRASGPRQNAQTNTIDLNNISQLPMNGRAMGSLKLAGEKKFEKRDGAWYDTSYHGQATKDVRRGSPAYKALDEGLKSIASSLGGVVVVVWKGTAYRIQ